jgi:hypothetical protein
MLTDEDQDLDSTDNESSSGVEIISPQLKIHRSKTEVTAYMTSPQRPRNRDLSTASTTIEPLHNIPSASKPPTETQLAFFESLIGLLHYLCKPGDIPRFYERIQQTVALGTYPKPQCLLHWIKSNSTKDMKVSSPLFLKIGKLV